MEDMTPELLKQIQEEFGEKYKTDNEVKILLEKLSKGAAGYEQAYEYAASIGGILAETYSENISSNILPKGRMWYNIGNRVVAPTLEENCQRVSEYTREVQEKLNREAGIGIKPIEPPVNKDRIQGIIDRLSSEEDFDKVAWILKEPIKTLARNVVDTFIKENVNFHGKAGMQPKILRRSSGACCKWCNEVAGVYYYPDVPDDVYRRHENCDCIVEYDPGNGKYQNVHSKKWRDNISDIEKRKLVGINNEKYFIRKGKDITDEYEHNKLPRQGSLTYDEGYDKEKYCKEVDMAEWLYKNLGGDIKVLSESPEDEVKMPDYMWNGKYWELKSTTTEKAANSALRKGIKQIERNPGGIILNYPEEINLQEAIEIIEKRMKGSKKGDIPVDVMIIIKDKLKMVIRY